jgi:beta-galactosidase
VGFYRTIFTLPDSWSGQPVLLHFEGVTYRCEAWIDGRYIGSHEGGYTPFWFDITPYIHAGSQSELIVRVAGLSKTKAVDGMLLHQTPLSKQGWYYAFGGIWGQVFLESCPWVALQSLTVDPDLRREKAQLEITLNNRQAQVHPLKLHINVIDPHGVTVFELDDSVSAIPGEINLDYTLHLPKPFTWTCEQPDLYRVEVLTRDEHGPQDRQSAIFGMRDFTAQDGQFFLNGEPIFIRGVLLQPNFPVNLVTHPDPEMMVREITLAKEAGFNLIRTHIQPSPPGYLDLTDKMGMLVYAESCLAWIRESPRLLDHGRREIKAMIDRDRNHPSVVFWGIYNENPTSSEINSEALVRLARQIDPTRVIIDDSGGSLAIDQDFGWIDRAMITPPRQAQPERILDVHLYLGAPISRSIYAWLCKLGSGASSRVLAEERVGSLPVMEEFDRECRSYLGKVFVSELGYGGMSDLEDTVARFDGREDLLDARELKAFRDSLREGFAKRKLDRIFGSLHNLFLEAQQVHALGNTQQLEALLTNPRVSGYVITQLNDVAWEFHAGLLDLWRNPKLAYYAAQKVNQPQILILNPHKVTATIGETVEVDQTLVMNAPTAGRGRMITTVEDPQGKPVFTATHELSLFRSIQPLASLQVELRLPGSYQVSTQLVKDDQTLAESGVAIQAFDPLDWSDLPFSITGWGQTPDAPSFNTVLQKHEDSQDLKNKTDHRINLISNPATLADQEWEALFAAVRSGEGAVIGALFPEDKEAIGAINRQHIKLDLHPGIGSWMGCYHWVPDSELFSGLPAGGFAKREYAELYQSMCFQSWGEKSWLARFAIPNPGRRLRQCCGTVISRPSASAKG